jgi:hypothetical protein
MSYVGNVHNSGYVVADITKIFFKHVLHSVSTEIAYMSKMINGRTAGVHRHLSRLAGYKLVLCSCK